MAKGVSSIVRNLQRRNARRRLPLVVLEGVRLVEEALAASVPLTAAAASPALERSPRGRRLLEALRAAAPTVERLSDRELAALADTESPQGVLAVAEPTPWTFDDVEVSSRSAYLALDGVQDPGNVGSVLRTALGLGADAVFLLAGTARVTHPKVLRAAMGATFHLPAVPAGGAEFLDWARRHGVTLWAADAAGTPVTRLAPHGPIAILVGNEGTGLSRALAQAAHERVAVPLAPRVESLNAAVAAGILLHEVRRDR